MSVSKIHPIRHSVLDAVNYITNPDKTDGEIYVSTYACGLYTADLEFSETALEGSGIGNVKAQHLIQAFKPGEVTPEIAHEIGRKLAIRATDGKHEFVIATHVDKGHIHNHIIFNQVSFVDHNKYRGNIYCQRQIAKINDELCAQYGLSVIKNNAEKGKSYYDYKDIKSNNSNRQILKNTIDSCIPLVSSFDEMLGMLGKFGYEIKESKANISVRKEGSERFIRLKNLGEKYTVDGISERIKYRNVNGELFIPSRREQIGLLKDLSDRLDTIKSPAYKNKVALSEVKRIAATYSFLNEHGITSASKIADTLDAWSLSIKEKRDEIRSLESSMGTSKQVLEALERREKYNDVYAAYLKSGKSKEFKEKHSADIVLFEGACKVLSAKGIDPATRAADYRVGLNEMTAKRDALLESYHNLTSDFKQLGIAQKNLDIIMNDRQMTNVKARKKDRDI